MKDKLSREDFLKALRGERLRHAEENKKHSEFEIKRTQQQFVTPRCCQTCIDRATVFLGVPEEFFHGYIDEATPEWFVRASNGSFDSYRCVAVAGCPHCLTPVPKIVRRGPIEKKICTCTDGGYYCATCDERLMSCKCLPVAFHWKPEGASDGYSPNPKPLRHARPLPAGGDAEQGGPADGADVPGGGGDAEHQPGDNGPQTNDRLRG
jgi:hypothetical protein